MSLLVTTKLPNGYRQREREHFDKLARRHEETWWGHHRPAASLRLSRRVDMLCERLQCMSNPRVLEIGCGTGIFTKALLERMPDLHLIGCDISPASVEMARRQLASFPAVRIDLVDVFEDTYDSDQFDAIVGASILHHLRLEEYLPRAIRILRPGGLFWFSEPNMANPQVALERNVRVLGKWLDNSEDETAFFRWRLRRWLLRSGFESVSIVPFDFLHPSLPRAFLGIVTRFSRVMEQTPLLKEIAGSLQIVAYKPRTT